MKKIIVPIDFSDCSKNALKNAIILAERLHMEIVIFHSLMAPVGFAEGSAISAMEIDLKSIEDKANADIQNMLREFPQIDKVGYHVETQYGSLSDQMATMTNEMPVGMIIMGTHGAKGLKKVFLGSNAFNVMKKVTCPVIAIPEEADISSLKQLAIALDYHSVPNHDVLTMMNRLAKAFFSELHLVHVEGEEEDKKRSLEVARSMDQYLKAIPHQYHFLQSESLEDALTDFALDNGIDLLMLVSKHHGFIDRIRHGSHTRNLMLEMPIPLMVFHE